jgi:antitoxin FitA
VCGWWQAAGSRQYTAKTLRVRVARHGRNTEADVRAILANAVKPEQWISLGSPTGDIGRRAELIEKTCEPG